jgi:hypothetical protein
MQDMQEIEMRKSGRHDTEATMRDPISETAHYVTLARDGDAGPALVQGGRLVESGWVRVVRKSPIGRARRPRLHAGSLLRTALAWLGGLV